MSAAIKKELVECGLPIPEGYRFVGFREPSYGECALGRSGGVVTVNETIHDCGKVIVIEPVNPPDIDDYIEDWPSYMARRVYIAMDEKPERRWIMYSAERLPVFDQRTGQWSGDVLCRLDFVKRAVPGLMLPSDEIIASESLRWVE